MARSSRRIAPSSGYIGAGNKTEAFSRPSRVPFAKIRARYLRESGRLTGRDKHFAAALSEEEKQRIRKRIISYYQRQRVTRFLALLLSLILTGALIISALHWIEI